MRSLADTAAAGWPITVMLAIGLVSQGLRSGRRRCALNRALHEVRRPLQVLAMTAPGARAGGDGTLALAISALAQLEAEVNGGRSARSAGPSEEPPTRCKDLLQAAAARWRSRAAMVGGSIELRWRGQDDPLVSSPAAVAQAVDNLIVNAIEHGGPAIIVEGGSRDDTVRIRVSDSGRGSRVGWRRESPAAAIARLTGRQQRGHGLEVVRRLAREQGGRFVLHRSERQSVAALELPLARDGDRSRAA